MPIFLGSPGDLSAERRYAKECVDEWNLVNESRTGWTVDLVGWEDTLPQTGRPQAVINVDVERCSIFIGMMWKKWGSATGNGYTSGFHEEFELASGLHSKNGAPRIAMFFKEIPSADDPGEELKKVLHFKKGIIDGKALLFKELSSDEEVWKVSFRQNVHRIIFEYIADQDVATAPPIGTEPDSSSAPDALVPSADGEVSDNLSLVRTLMSRLGGLKADEEVSNARVAQLRLAALGWKRRGLSDTYLGTHDANIIYRAAEVLNISEIEKLALIDAGLSTIGSQNAPIWKWISSTPNGEIYLYLTAIMGDEDGLSAAAFKALRKLKTAIPPAWDERFRREFPSYKDDRKRSAISYMSRMGGDDYLALLRAEIERADTTVRDAAIVAIANILSRDSYVAALIFIIDDVASLPRSLRPMLAKLSTLDVATLKRGLSSRDSLIRASSLKALRELGGASVEEAVLLRGDPVASVRKEAVLYARSAGEAISLDDARKIIVRKSQKSSNLFLSSPDGTSEFEEVERLMIGEFSDAALQEAQMEFYSPADFAYQTLAMRNWKTLAPQVRADVADNFADYFSRVRAAYVRKFGEEVADRSLANFSENLRDFRARYMRRAALNVIATKGEARDLPIVRDILEAETPVEEVDLKYLSKHGEWSDIARIDTASNRYRGLSLGESDGVSDLAARAICVLAKQRAHDLAKLGISQSMKADVFRWMSKSEFSSLDDSDILEILSEKDDTLRIVVAQKCVATMPKKRVDRILNAYLNLDHIFYNAIHWLDLGLALPRRQVEAVLSCEAG